MKYSIALMALSLFAADAVAQNSAQQSHYRQYFVCPYLYRPCWRFVRNLLDGGAGNRLAIKKYDAATDTWQPLGDNNANLYVFAGSVNNGVSQYSSTPRSSLVFDSNHTPYIAFGDNGNLVPFVKKFDNDAWITVGDSAVNSAGKAVAMSLVIDENEVIWLAYCEL